MLCVKALILIAGVALGLYAPDALLVSLGLVLAEAVFDMIAASYMMDGRVCAIVDALDGGGRCVVQFMA